MSVFDNQITHIPQRQHDDSAICCVAMAAGVSYEQALAAVFRDHEAPHNVLITRLSWHCLPSDIRKGLAALGIVMNVIGSGLFEITEHFDVLKVQPALLSGFVGGAWKQSWVLLHEGTIYDPSLEGPIALDEWATDMDGFMSLKGAKNYGLG